MVLYGTVQCGTVRGAISDYEWKKNSIEDGKYLGGDPVQVAQNR